MNEETYTYEDYMNGEPMPPGLEEIGEVRDIPSYLRAHDYQTIPLRGLLTGVAASIPLWTLIIWAGLWMVNR